ncbi:MAG: hypothetical protein NC922_06990 [Candidatus Omnitrophica bacterium]|nr:hypothetical protein [Candidatus Omnitrophota bacterium]
MNINSNKFLLFFSFLLFSNLLFAGRPLTTEDAETVEKGKFELEIGYDLIKNNDDTKNKELGVSLKFGLTDRMDFGISVPFIIEENSINLNKWEKPEIGIKFSILKEDTLNISFQFSGTPNPEEGNIKYTIKSILSKNFGKTILHFNLGLYSLKNSNESEYYLTYSSAFEYPLSEKLNLCGEIVGEKNEENPLTMLIGFNYAFSKNLKFDFGIGSGINKSAPDWKITTGLTFNW